MRTFIILLLFSVFATAQEVKVIKFPELEAYFNKQNDTLYIINFWATWCKPCIQELPAFEEIHEDFKTAGVKVLLVSLDFIDKLDKQLKPFMKKNYIDAEVVLLDEPKYNDWIDKVSTEWGGAIPATLFVMSSKSIHDFYEKEFTYMELANKIQTIKK